MRALSLRRRFPTPLLFALLFDCGGVTDLPVPSDSECRAETRARAIEGAAHLPNCSPVSYASNPPSSGNHYGTWAAHGIYDAPLPRGFWVHNLEHGAVVISYNCPDGCADDVARAKQFLNELPVDPSCPEGRRVLLVPDPLLDVRWGASAWGFNLRAECFDPTAFREFYLKHYASAPEDVCSEGTDFRAPDGLLDLPPGCGE